MKYIYPAIFENDEEDKEMINVIFPDILGGTTFGKGRKVAESMAKDLLKDMIMNAPAQCLKPLSLEETQKIFPNKTIVMVEVEV